MSTTETSSSEGSGSDEELVDFLDDDSDFGAAETVELVDPTDTESVEIEHLDVFGAEHRSYASILRSAFEKAGLSHDHLQQFLDALQSAQYDDTMYIVRQGEVGDKFFIISEGEVSVWAHVETEL